MTLRPGCVELKEGDHLLFEILERDDWRNLYPVEKAYFNVIFFFIDKPLAQYTVVKF